MTDEVERVAIALSKQAADTGVINFIALAKAAIAAMDRGWRPIETAPKDGTAFLAIIAGNHPTTNFPFLPEVCVWDDISMEVRSLNYLEDVNEIDDEATIRSQIEWSKELTHWMPLPTPPKGGSDEHN